MDGLIQANQVLLNQGQSLLASLGDNEYTTPCEACFGATCGAHFRHALEHYQGLLSGLATQVVDYDQRERGSPVEKSRLVALGMASEFAIRLECLTSIDKHLPVQVVVDDGNEPRISHSTMERELQFVLSHTVHHFALIRTLLHVLGRRDFPDGFGVAPSTIRYLAGVHQ